MRRRKELVSRFLAHPGVPENASRIRKKEYSPLRKPQAARRGASLGNFGVANISDKETWVTVGECMYSPECEKRGSNGTLFAARLLWSRPNAVVTGERTLSP